MRATCRSEPCSRIGPSREGSGTCLQDNRAVGNSRLVPRDGLNVSCKQVPGPDPWYSSLWFQILSVYVARMAASYRASKLLSNIGASGSGSGSV